jgi:hypothetical protein
MACGTKSVLKDDCISCKYLVVIELGLDCYKRAEVGTKVVFCDTEQEAKAAILNEISNTELSWLCIEEGKPFPTAEAVAEFNYDHEFCLMNPKVAWTVYTSRGAKTHFLWHDELIQKDLEKAIEIFKSRQDE